MRSFVFLMLGFFVMPLWAEQKCNSAEFLSAYLRRTACDGSQTMTCLGLLGIGSVGGKAYKALSQLASESQQYKEFKNIVDVIEAKRAEAIRQSMAFVSIGAELAQKYENKYGKDWQNNSQHYAEFLAEYNFEARHRGLPSFEEMSDPQKNGKSYFQEIQKRLGASVSITASLAEAILEYAEIELNLQLAEARRKVSEYLKGASSGSQVEIFQEKQGITRARENFIKALQNMINAALTVVPVSTPRNRRTFVATGRALSVPVGVFVGGVGAATAAFTMGATSAQASTALQNCREQFQLTDSDIASLIHAVDTKNLPSLSHGSSACSQINIKTEELPNLINKSGEFSPGVCKMMHKKVEFLEEEQEKPFELNKNCDHANLKVNGATVGSFNRLTETRAYFEIPPHDKNFGVRVPIALEHDGRMEFRADLVECLDQKNNQVFVRKSCNADQRQQLGGAAVGDKEERLFHASRICPSTKGTTTGDSLCDFAQVAPQIRQAMALYSVACLQQTVAAADSSPKTK